MFLSQFLDSYAIYRDVEESTIQQYRYVVKCFSQFLGREANLDDLKVELVNDWIKSIKGRLSPHTCKSRRMTILVIWNLATRLDLAGPPKNVRIVRTPDLLIPTLTREQVNDLRSACDRLRKMWKSVTVCGYMRTIVDATLETALRQSDLHRIKLSQICDRPIHIIQKKTGYRRMAVLSETLIARILAWHNRQEFIWPAHSRTLIATRLRLLGRKLGIDNLTHTTLRKTAISDVEAQSPGTGWIFAGHRSPATTQKWYTDANQQYLGLPRTRF